MSLLRESYNLALVC